MLNALTMMAARDRGGTFGIGVDGDDFILESTTLLQERLQVLSVLRGVICVARTVLAHSRSFLLQGLHE